MKQIQFFLIPAPGQKPSFLATAECLKDAPLNDNEKKLWEISMPSQIVLETYTRDGWAWKPNPACFVSYKIQSIDGRGKLPGFLKYLKERQKACFGKVALKNNPQPTSKGGICVVSYIQPKFPNENCMECRIALDIQQIPNCPLAGTSKPQQQPQQAQQQQQQEQPTNKKRKVGGGGMGFLGGLVEGQKRTNHHVMIAKAPVKAVKNVKTPSTTAASADADNNDGANDEHDNDNHGNAAANDEGGPCGTKTAQDIMAEFRQSCQDQLLDFDISDDPVLRIPVKLSKFHNDMVSAPEERERVTLEILKFIVYEQAEEVNEEWVAAKEPSEFLDEFNVAVYKEGHAPEEVLEDLNQGDLPDEIRGQQKALVEQQNRANEAKELARVKELQRQALQKMGKAEHGGGDALNTKKRDRRTIEEIQRDFQGS